MDRILVKRKDGTSRIVIILWDRNTKQYCFVNLTTGHVCKCRFDTYNDAMNDLRNNESVVEFIILPTEQ